jgi:radical SAM protein with 4Fe4S-binding SPASM domain
MKAHAERPNLKWPDLKWIDKFWDQAGKHIFFREEDEILILPPNRVYKINKTGIDLLRFLEKGGKIGRLASGKLTLERLISPERFISIEGFFKTIAGLYADDGIVQSDLPRIRYAFDFTRLPILGEIALTYRCNNRCAFCYAGCGPDDGAPANEGSGVAGTPGIAKRRNMEDLDAGEWKRIIRIFRDEARIPFFSFSGGEPLLRRDLEELISYAVGLGLEVNLVSNGTLADRARSRSLFAAGLRTAQISLEAPDAALHDLLTGRTGAFVETVRGMEALQKAGISVQTNTTITALNREAAPEMPAFLAGRGIKRFAMNMYIPAPGAAREDLRVGYDEIGFTVDKVRKAAFKKGLTFYWYSPTPFCFYNPIALGMGNKSCAAADGLISVAANGDVLPCSSWDEPIGNLLQRPFRDIWFSDRAMFFKRKRHAPESCKSCSSFTACQGACPLYWRSYGEDLLPGKTPPPAKARVEVAGANP